MGPDVFEFLLWVLYLPIGVASAYSFKWLAKVHSEWAEFDSGDAVFIMFLWPIINTLLIIYEFFALISWLFKKGGFKKNEGI